MPNPLNPTSSNIAAGGMPINPTMINNIAQMARRGADMKSIITTLRKQGITPDAAEQMLCMAFPQMRQIRDQMKQSGLSTQQYIQKVAKEKNIPEEQMNQTLNDIASMFR